MKKAPPRRIKDLPSDQSLGGVRFRYPGDGEVYYWRSQWQKGVWGAKTVDGTQIFPLFCEDIKEALDWEIVPCD